MKTLGVIGCHGLLGQNLVALAAPDYHLVGMDLQEQSFLSLPSFDYIQGSITDRSSLETLRKFSVDHIINCAAYTAVDRAETEREKCWSVNADGPRNLAVLARRMKVPLIHISTDYIFDGKNGPYLENDTPHPISVYGKSKLAGENLIRGELEDYAIIRTMVLYGKGLRLKTDFVQWVIESLRSEQTIRVVDDQWGNTTFAPVLARTILQIVESGRRGIFHAGSSDIVNRFEFARQIAAVFELPESYILPVKTSEFNQPAPRPLLSGLRVDETVKKLGVNFPETRQALEEYRNQKPQAYRMN